MTTKQSASNHVSIDARPDLLRPELQFIETSGHVDPSTALPAVNAPANIQDSGRIRYGSIARMPVAR